MMKIITNRLIPTIFLLAVSVSLIVVAVNLNQVFAQNPSNTDPNVLKGSITSTLLQMTAIQQSLPGY